MNQNERPLSFSAKTARVLNSQISSVCGQKSERCSHITTVNSISSMPDLTGVHIGGEPGSEYREFRVVRYQMNLSLEFRSYSKRKLSRTGERHKQANGTPYD